MPKVKPPLNLGALLPSWELALRAERKSPATVKSYGDGVRRFLAWCEQTGTPPALTRPAVNGFTAALLAEGSEAATVRSRQLGIRRFSAWLVEEEEQSADQLIGIKAPKLDSKVIEPLTEQQLLAMIKACGGKDYRDRRDEALIRFMVETATRAGEVIALTVADVNLQAGAGSAIVRKGKGGKGRVVPFGDKTTLALDRYRRARAAHKLADSPAHKPGDSPAFWLGDRNRGFTYYALHAALRGRAEAAGITGFHPHLLRHTAAHRWLAAGGSEGALMAIAGWTQPDMLMRYTRARASERAATEARSLNLGDL